MMINKNVAVMKEGKMTATTVFAQTGENFMGMYIQFTDSRLISEANPEGIFFKLSQHGGMLLNRAELDVDKISEISETCENTAIQMIVDCADQYVESLNLTQKP